MIDWLIIFSFQCGLFSLVLFPDFYLQYPLITIMFITFPIVKFIIKLIIIIATPMSPQNSFTLHLLIYLEDNISTQLIEKPDNSLKKGGPYDYLDTATTALLTLVMSLFGLPWVSALYIRSAYQLQISFDLTRRMMNDNNSNNYDHHYCHCLWFDDDNNNNNKWTIFTFLFHYYYYHFQVSNHNQIPSLS